MTVDDVIKLSKAGLSDDLIVEQIEKKGQRLDLSTEQLIQLKQAKVSDRVIAAMIDPTGGTVTPAKAVVSPAAAAPAASPASATSLTVRREDAKSDLPAEAGVYAKEKGKWIEVLPEVVNWKTGGVLKSIATVGVVKGDVNGLVNGTTSRNELTTPVKFLIVVPEGVAITEYQLLRLHQHGKDREFRTVTGGVFHVSGGATRDLMSFEPTKVEDRTYQVILSSGAGEYGLLPPGAVFSKNAASLGKIYSFRIVE
jgi:hypothetical protein